MLKKHELGITPYIENISSRDQSLVIMGTSRVTLHNLVIRMSLTLYFEDASDLSELRADVGRAAEYGLGVQRLAAQVTDNDDNDCIVLYLCRFVTHGSRRFVAVRT